MKSRHFIAVGTEDACGACVSAAPSPRAALEGQVLNGCVPLGVEEVSPEAQQNKSSDIATLGFIGGFIVMMTLDVVLG